MKKKILLLFLTILGIITLTGCNSKDNGDPVLTICDDFLTIKSDYENNKIDKKELITKIDELNNKCTGDANPCISLNGARSTLNENTKDELVNAKLTIIKTSCERYKQSK